MFTTLHDLPIGGMPGMLAPLSQRKGGWLIGL